MSFIATLTIHYRGSDLENHIAGVSNDFNEACKMLIKKCVDLDCISYETFVEGLEDEDEVDNMTIEKFMKVLYTQNLPDIFKSYGDSYYDDGWFPNIYKLVQGEWVNCELEDYIPDKDDDQSEENNELSDSE